jgi:hypothetical protein
MSPNITRICRRLVWKVHTNGILRRMEPGEPVTCEGRVTDFPSELQTSHVIIKFVLSLFYKDRSFTMYFTVS